MMLEVPSPVATKREHSYWLLWVTSNVSPHVVPTMLWREIPGLLYKNEGAREGSAAAEAGC